MRVSIASRRDFTSLEDRLDKPVGRLCRAVAQSTLQMSEVDQPRRDSCLEEQDTQSTGYTNAAKQPLT